MSDQRPPPPPAFIPRQPGSPVRFPTSSNAFGLTVSPISSTSSTHHDGQSSFSATAGGLAPGRADNSPPSAGTVSARRMRRPSMLSLAQNASFGDSGNEEDAVPMENTLEADPPVLPSAAAPLPQSTNAEAGPSHQRMTVSAPFGAQDSPRWGGPAATSTPFLTNSFIRRSSASPLTIEGLSTNLSAAERSPPPLDISVRPTATEEGISPSASPTDTRWAVNPLRRVSRDSSGEVDTAEGPAVPRAASFNVRPLPASLLATLISEQAPLAHEMRSEARLQRLLSSHPSALPLTPRAPRSVRGRFPETAGDEDEDEDSFSRSWHQRNWLGRGPRPPSSDSDSDDGAMEEIVEPNEPVNSAFAAGMDMDRPESSSSSSTGLGGIAAGGAAPFGWTGGIMRTNAPRMSFGVAGQAAGMRMAPSPGPGLGLPSAFGGLGMGGNGGTPLTSPTIERLELAGSPGAMSVTSPSLLQYRESTGGSASVRPGKRKAGQDDRFDPYKRPRGSSPSLLSASPGLAMSPSRGPSIPIPQSPSHVPLYSSALNSTIPQAMLNSRNARAYPRAMPRSRSRAASPALSIGSTSGVLSTSLGNGGSTAGGRPSFSLGQAFIATGAGSDIVPRGNAPQELGGLGLLSLNNKTPDAGGSGLNPNVYQKADALAHGEAETGRQERGGSGGSGASGGEEMLRADSMGGDSVVMEED